MKDWNQVLVRSDTLIEAVVKIIDESPYKIALVTDEKKILKGTITDGDIRRGFLRGMTLKNEAQNIMKKKPVTMKAGANRNEILGALRKHKLHQMPLVDDQGTVLGIELLDEMSAIHPCENWVVLMAGGMGSRLRPLTESVPKPLIKVGEKPLLETIMQNFISQGFRKFFFAVNYRQDMIFEHFQNGENYGVQIEYLREDEQLGTAGALSLLPEKPTKPVIVMNADLLTKVNFEQLLAFHAEHRSAATLCVRDYGFQLPYGVVELDNLSVKQIDEKPMKHFFVNAGIYVLDPDALECIPAQTVMDMPTLLGKLVEKNQEVSAFPIREYWIDIGRLDDLEKANAEFSTWFK